MNGFVKAKVKGFCLPCILVSALLGGGRAVHAGELLGDLDGNQAVDLQDHVQFLACFMGPDEVSELECGPADFISDLHVDQFDWSAFQLEFGSVELCEPGWAEGLFHFNGVNGGIRAMTVFDDGTGSALYAGGGFTYAGPTLASDIAKWDGTDWSALGSGMNGGSVSALVVFDDGSGPALYAGGDFTAAGGVSANNIAKWNGTNWSALGSGTNSTVSALAVFDDGTGPALYAGGHFTTAGGAPASRIAKWNGTTWSPIGSGISGGCCGSVFALTVFDDGTGPALYAGGDSTLADGALARRVAKWNGMAWSPLGNGMDDTVLALTVFDDGTGPALYAGGEFSTAGTVSADSIAKWNGTAWSPLGSGIDGGAAFVYALTVFDDGTGPAIFVGGDFFSAGGGQATRIAKWNGTVWSPLGNGLSGGTCVEVKALTSFDDGKGPALYAGGDFAAAGGSPINGIAQWNGTSWSALAKGFNGSVSAMTVFDDGTGPALYMGGTFTAARGVPANRVAKWDGATWSPLGSGMLSEVLALAVFDDGMGSALYAGGYFEAAGGTQVNRVAKWNGAAWSPLASGMSGTGAFVSALAVFDDGMGPALYAGGYFTTAGGVSASNIAKWNGSAWSPLGNGMNDVVYALTVFDDGTGPALYAGGNFTLAGGVGASHIAKWNGTAWSPLAQNALSSSVYTLTVFDDGEGPALYAGGDFYIFIDGILRKRIAKWNGTNWSALGSGMDGVSSPFIYDLAVFDDGTGPALYAAGAFTTAGGAAIKRIAKWNGAAWLPVESGMNNSVYAMTVFDDGTGTALYAGGNFTTAGDVVSAYMARWGCPP